MGRGGTATRIEASYTTSLRRTSRFKGWLVYEYLLLDYRVYTGNQLLPSRFLQLRHTQSLLMYFCIFCRARARWPLLCLLHVAPL